jgi:predicted house-cleaning NTP pyrophosphatase (Maf/HAM1 superfamily)
VLIHRIAGQSSFPASEPQAYAMATALAKARQVHAALSDQEGEGPRPVLVLGADTIVVDSAGRIQEKPKDRVGAHHMLSQLAGTWHEVYTGVALVGGGPSAHQHPPPRTFYERTRVCFTALSPELLDFYLDHDSYRWAPCVCVCIALRACVTAWQPLIAQSWRHTGTRRVGMGSKDLQPSSSPASRVATTTLSDCRCIVWPKNWHPTLLEGDPAVASLVLIHRLVIPQNYS